MFVIFASFLAFLGRVEDWFDKHLEEATVILRMMHAGHRMSEICERKYIFYRYSIFIIVFIHCPNVTFIIPPTLVNSELTFYSKY